VPSDQDGCHALAVERFAFVVYFSLQPAGGDANEVVTEALRAEAEYHGLADDLTPPDHGERGCLID